jgi:YHS domain-containing protein
MMKLIACAVVCCAMACALVYSEPTPTKDQKPAPATRPTSQPTTKPVAINKFCAVDRENPVDDTVPTVTYEGKVIGFCCEDCIPKFKKNPKAYMKDLK